MASTRWTPIQSASNPARASSFIICKLVFLQDIHSGGAETPPQLIGHKPINGDKHVT